ncbi:MAG: hypothetical protein FJ317_05225 [SAR202 cluster bacterium]|nr:hypothetical protein [SAR202 cluster bacterium]
MGVRVGYLAAAIVVAMALASCAGDAASSLPSQSGEPANVLDMTPAPGSLAEREAQAIEAGEYKQLLNSFEDATIANEAGEGSGLYITSTSEAISISAAATPTPKICET